MQSPWQAINIKDGANGAVELQGMTDDFLVMAAFATLPKHEVVLSHTPLT